MFPSHISKKSDSQNDAKESEMSFSRSSKKDLPNDVALDEVNKHITDTLSILRREISKVRLNLYWTGRLWGQAGAVCFIKVL